MFEQGRIAESGLIGPCLLSLSSSDQEVLHLDDPDGERFSLGRRPPPEDCKPESPQPHPFPMPEYGGYYAPLSEFLPGSSQPLPGLHRWVDE